MKLFAQIFLQGLYNYLTNKYYRQFMKLVIKYGGKPRYINHTTSFLNYTMSVPDCRSFIWQFKEIFVDNNYLFNAENDTPVIYDCGSNIGTSVLFFKEYYPGAKIKAFEAEPKIFSILKQNIEFNKVDNVELFHKAVWINNDGIEITSEGADGSSIFGEGSKTKIDSVRLKELIEKEDSIDFLKIDIEGAETEVLKDCENSLKNIRNIFIEYHSFINKEQNLDLVLNILSKNGFRYFVKSAVHNKYPFMKKKNEYSPNIDLQTNIYAYK